MKITLDQANKWSNLQILCVKQRTKGICVDLDHIRKYIPVVKKEIERLKYEVCKSEILEEEIDSPIKLAKRLKLMSYDLPKTAKGGNSTDSKWMSQQEDPLLDMIVEYRTCKIILGTFFEKILDMQEYTCPEGYCGGRWGRVYPEYNLFGAMTGRFSSSHPNIQNIPARHPVWGPICRSIFWPEEGKIWVHADWSNQEGRLQVDYGLKINAPGAQKMLDEFIKDPYLDLHQTVADIAGIERSHAKTVNLGLSYSMGTKKLAKSLKLSLKQTEAVLDKYYQALPYLDVLKQEVQKALINNGRITTLGGRQALREPVWYTETGERVDKSYKALNKLIQGSGADMMYAAWEKCWEEGLDVLCVVHDEINIAVTNDEKGKKDIDRLRNIMENSLRTKVPMVVEITQGLCWGELK